MSELTQGLTISGFGILITFSALGILIGLIVLLKVLFPFKAETVPLERPDAVSSPTPSEEREDLLKQAAAVGVSVLIQKYGSGQGDLGKLLEEPVSDWWGKGLDRVHGKE